MSHTVTIPAKSNRTAVPDNMESTPYPRAYDRAKQFLKEMLRKEVETTERSTSQRKSPIACLIGEVGAPQVVNDFRKQLLAYARQEYPFNDACHENGAAEWWEALEQHRHARVLAVSTCDCSSVIISETYSTTDIGSQDLFDTCQFNAG